MMCITKEEFNSIKGHIKSVEDELKEHTKVYRAGQSKTLWFIVSNIVLLVGVGIWAGKLGEDVLHNREMISDRTADRFFQQDGKILDTKIENISSRQDRIEDSYVEINKKLDKLIERNY